MVAQLEDDESENFISLMASLGAGDGVSAANAILQFSDDEDYLSSEQKETFIKDVVLFFEESCRGYGTDVDVGDVLRGILGIIKPHHVRVDANYATLVVNVLCIEGLAKRVCPSYNVLDAAKPLLSSYRTLPIYKSKNRMLKAFILNYITPILYMQKNRYDKKFFKQLAQQRRPISILRKLSRKLSRIVIALASAKAILQIAKSDDGLQLLQVTLGKPMVAKIQGISGHKSCKESLDSIPLFSKIRKLCCASKSSTKEKWSRGTCD